MTIDLFAALVKSGEKRNTRDYGARLRWLTQPSSWSSRSREMSGAGAISWADKVRSGCNGFWKDWGNQCRSLIRLGKTSSEVKAIYLLHDSIHGTWRKLVFQSEGYDFSTV